MVLVSHRYKFIYLKNYKVAGSSVETFFRQFCIDPAEPYSYVYETDKQESEYGIVGSTILPADETWFNHKHASDIKRDIGDEIFNSYLKFCVVRNPYDVMVSAFFWERSIKRIERNLDFKTYCINYQPTYNRSNVSRILLDGTPVCNVYMRFENLKEDIIALCDRLGITDYDINKLPKHKTNIRLRAPYQEFYDDEIKEIVSNHFKTEIEMFGYTF
jgi:hypothetical protein